MTVQPRAVRKVPGMGGKVFNFRSTGLCPPSLSLRIRPLLMVNHIPVVAQAEGLADFQKLGNILRGKGLAIQAATDGDGNVALFTHWDDFCYGHRGANQLACGVEHMHLTTAKEFSEKQMRAAAWCAAQVWKHFGIPPRRGKLIPGDGLVGVERRGHTSHMNVSNMAGFHDRTDPGANFSYRHLYELARFFQEHHRF
jgi:N-acetylmuramoyl-L-alanine amidase